MKFNKFHWDLYKNSEKGKLVIGMFKNNDFKSIVQELAPKYKDAYGEDAERLYFCYDLADEIINFTFPEMINFETQEPYSLVEKIMEENIKYQLIDEDDNSEEIDSFFETSHDHEFLNNVNELSLILNYKYPDYFKPYYFLQRFETLVEIFYNYDITLPEIPKKRELRKRVFYYIEICKSLILFQKEVQLNNEELSAFLYDYAIEEIKGAKQVTQDIQMPQPTRAWLVGAPGDQVDDSFEDYKDDDEGFWQCNEDTQKGDIIVFYARTPKSEIHSIWRASSDGFKDPFFYYYSYIRITSPVKIPSLHLNILKNDEHFKDVPIVRSNMQGVAGTNLSYKDYERLKVLMQKEDVSYDLKNIPELYIPTIKNENEIKTERDVEVHLLEPLLFKLEYKEADWVRQLSLRMGRGERNYPDYAVAFSKERGHEKAEILIEAKYHMKHNRDILECFIQAHSYALRLSSNIIILCDKESFFIYKKVGNVFDNKVFIRFFWNQLEEKNVFEQVIQLIGKRFI